ncbi:hypothetical protein [Bacillus nitratireducens]|uniref:hypothetical protein n=1 Tax=Bacillus nitratireducens TaxID=2026193 RepID=UPI00119F055A|nr:hypothetical protein [Bacillus nitratireducens]
MKKNNIFVREFNLGKFSFLYRKGDLFLLVLFIVTFKSFYTGEIQHAIFFVLLAIWKEIYIGVKYRLPGND